MKRALLLLLLFAACAGEPHSATVWGHAMLAGLDDHSGITVSLSKHDATATTDAFGYFAFPEVPAGDYVVTASHPGTFERRVSAAVEHDGERPSGAYLVLTPFARIGGSVRTEGGEPLVGATVAVLGHAARATSVEEGRFSIDPAPAGELTLLATATGFAPATAPVHAGAGASAAADFILTRAAAPDPYADNAPPELSPIALTARPDQTEPRPIPLVDISSGRVRRRGVYELAVSTSDPDGDDVAVYWTADCGTLLSTFGDAVLWRAGAGTATLVATAVDARGGTATVRHSVESTTDDIRGAGRADDRIYYAERRDDTYDVYSYHLESGEERLEVAGEVEQHAATVVDDHLVWADTEFVFLSDLVYRVRARPLGGGPDVEVGQPFGHDATFVMRLDLYTPLHSLLVPYSSIDGSVAPVGYGYADLSGGTTTAAYDPSASPANIRSFARDGGRDVWLTANGQLFTRSAGGSAELLVNLPHSTPWPENLELDGGVVALLWERGAPLYWLDVDAPGAGYALAGRSVTSFAMDYPSLAWVEQGPSVASVEVLHLETGEQRTLSNEPHVARRIWFLDDEVVIWGDQGVPGQSFVELNTELLWVARLPW